MGATPYQEKLLEALDRAIVQRFPGVEAKLQAMLIAVESGWYSHLAGLHAALPADYAAMLGDPPASPDRDR